MELTENLSEKQWKMREKRTFLYFLLDYWLPI
nr:MAG TPA: hypothetical protein [Caudoviricetes sp.]